MAKRPQKIFSGFSTYDGLHHRDWKRYDVDLIKRDLLNHFHTKVGERVMRPDWGCKIWDWLMEPMTAHLRAQIAEEAERICREDSRVAVVQVDVTEMEHGVRVAITLDYKPLNVVDTFALDFEKRQSDVISVN